MLSIGAIGILSAILLLLACQVVVVVLCVRWAARQKTEMRLLVSEFVESHDDQPSPMAILVDQMATVFAARVWQQIESRLRAGVSKTSREDNAETLQEATAGNPLATLALAFLPKKLRTQMINNPQMLGALANMVSGGAKSNGQASDVSERLKRGV